MTREQLCLEYRALAVGIARKYRIRGADAEDVKQEALLGLWVAAREWDPALGVPFAAFARLVVERKVQSAVRTATTGKHLVLSQSVREVVFDDGERVPAVDVIETPDPYARLDDRDAVRRIVAAWPSLSALQREAMLMVINGERYAGNKRIDNAVQMARVKLRAAA